MKRWLQAFATLCVFCTGAVAQNAPVATPPNHQHHVIDSPMIDGKDHPEPNPGPSRLWGIIQVTPITSRTRQKTRVL